MCSILGTEVQVCSRCEKVACDHSLSVVLAVFPRLESNHQLGEAQMGSHLARSTSSRWMVSGGIFDVNNVSLGASNM